MGESPEVALGRDRLNGEAGLGMKTGPGKNSLPDHVNVRDRSKSASALERKNRDVLHAGNAEGIAHPEARPSPPAKQNFCVVGPATC